MREHESETFVHPTGGPGQTTSGRPVVWVEFYTDPLCSWSWGMEPQWRKLRHALGDAIQWRYRMCGMIADWQSYSDPILGVDRPSQMGPQWYEVRHLTGMPVEDRIWFEDPPGSSYPACVACKAAGLQSAAAAERYLRRVREAVMVERRNVAKRDVLFTIAEQVEAEHPGKLDARKLKEAMADGTALDAFREDLKEARYREIGRFPTLVVHSRETRQGVMLVGYRPYEKLRGAVAKVVKDVEADKSETDAVSYLRYWGRAAAREVAEGVGITTDQAAVRLDAAVEQGELKRAGPIYTAS